MRCCYCCLSFIPQTISEKIDAEMMNTAFSIGSVPNSATEGIRNMQAISNLPSSTWLGFEPRWAAAGREWENVT